MEPPMEEEAPPETPRSEPTAPLSVSQILSLHRRERLLVRPLRWTDRHLELLGCSFSGPSRAPPTRTPVLFGKRGSGGLRYAEYRDWELPYREDVLPDLLGKDGPFERLPNLQFTFNGRHVQTLQCTVFLPRIQQELDPTILQELDAWPPLIAAYVDLERISLLRWDLFRLPIERQRCRSAHSLSRLQLKKVTPRNRLQDPYVVAILIALAQVNKFRAGLREEPDLSLFTSQVLASSTNTETVYLYTARIASSFLCSLEDPTFEPPEPTSIPVEITTIPYKPFRSLRDRLTALLLPEQDLARMRETVGKGQDTRYYKMRSNEVDIPPP